MSQGRPASPAQYQYEPLSHPDSIRILILHPAPPSQERIDVSLLEFRLSDPELAFNALSYTWQTADEAKNGEKPALMQVLCDDAVLSVGANCHAFLRRLRHPSDVRVWWVDAVCIDQSNAEERSAQVSLMRRIYSQAGVVVVWLGDTSPEIDPETSLPLSDLGMQFIYEFAAEIVERVNGSLDIGGGAIYQEFIRERTAFRGKGTGEVLTPRVRGLWEIMRRPWWTRLWTVQELALGKEVSLTLGDEYQPFDNLEIIIEAIMREGQAPEELEYNRSFLAPASHMFAMRGYLQSDENAPSSEPGKKALHVLDSTRNAVATDPRDKIYGILGFFGDIGADPHNIFPAPDYKKTAAELYSDVSRSVITSTGSLDVISSCHGFLENSIPDLPSWAASWNDTPLGYYNLKTFDAARGSRVVYEHSDDYRLLKVKGKRLDRVERIRGPHEDMSYSDTGCVFLWYFWHKYATSSWPPHATGESTEDVLLSTLCWGNDLVRGRLEPGDYREAFDAWLEILLSEGPIGPANLESVAKRIFEDKVAFKFSRRAWFVMIGRTLGMTGKSYLTMLPVGVKEGDELVILSGGRVPFVVRAEGGNYKLVGAAFVHGMMDGEAFEMEDSGSSALEWFTLC